MAKLFLDSTDTSYKVSNSNTEIFGANGDQAITIDGALSNIVLDANVERVAFTGATTDYTYKQVGTDLEVYKNGALVTKVGLQDDTNGTLLTFANGTVNAKFAPSATGLGVTVGGQTVSTSAPAAVTIPAANIDVTTYPITAPTFAVASVAASATEGTNAIWTVTLANAPSTTTTVKYTLKNESGATNDDTADEVVTGTGVTATPSVETATNSGIWEGTLTFAAGATTATISLPVNLDGLTEVGEAMSLTLSNPTGGAIINEAGKAATVTFVDAPATTFTLTSTGTGVEVQEGNTITFTVTPNAAVNAATTLILNVKGEVLGAVTSTASAADFETTPSITFAQGETAAKTITLKVATDGVVEGREAYSAEIVDTLNYASRSNKVQGVITDKLPTLSLSQNVSTVNEGSTVTYTVTSDENAPAGGITIPFTVAGTATSGSDYTALTASSITIPAGSKTGSVTLTTIADTTTEGDETVVVTLGEVANANVSATAKTVTTTIADTSKALGTAEMTLTGATSVDEGSTVTYTVTLGANAPAAGLSIPYTLSGTATSGTDFTGSTGTITVAGGAKTGTLTLTTVADSITEGAETVTLTLGSAGGFTAASGQGAVTTTINDTSIAVTGSSFSLTKSVQSLVGTAGNDTFIAGDEGGSATLNAGDQIDGGLGIDVLKIYNAAGVLNGANFTSAVVSGVEQIELTTAATAEVINVSNNADVKKVSLVNGFDGSVTLKLAQTAGLSGAIASTAAATFVFTDNSGGADTANLEVNAANLTTTGTVKGVLIAGVETLNIAATGSNSLGSVAVDATKLVITGSGSVSGTLKASAAAASVTKTIDATTATGNLTIDNKSAAAQVESIKTGSGNDTYTTVYANLTGDDVIELGTGTDSLRFSDATTFNSAATKAFLAKVTGVEQLGVEGAVALTVDGDFVSQTSYYAGTTGASVALTNIANNADLNFGTGAIAASTVGMKLGASILNVNLAGSKTTASDASAGLTVTGSATVNVKSSGVDGTADNKLALTAADNQSVVVTGAQNLTLTTTAAVATTGFSIDGSAFTGKLTVTGTAAADVIKGGLGADTISGGAGATVADTLTGNAGADKFIIIAGATSTTFDTITDFVTKSDTISFGAAVLAANYSEATVAVADFAAALAAANLVLTKADGTKQVNVQQVGSDSYAFYNDGVATGADMVVKLTGVSFAGIEAADIVA